MILVRPSWSVEAYTPDPEKTIEAAGRTCYRSEGRIEPGSADKFCRMVLARGHESVLEHASMTVRFAIDRGVSLELVRHRLAAFSQESTRFCDQDRDGHVAFMIPPWLNLPEGEYFGDVETSLVTSNGVAFDALHDGGGLGGHVWLRHLLHAEACYRHLRNSGWRPEQARSVLPNALATTIVMTANVREWRHVFRLRCASVAHPQMREVMIPLRDEFAKRWPALFGDLVV